MSDHPKRHDSSLELTAVRPRPPLSDIPGPTIDQLANVERMRRDIEDEAPPTLDACPAAGCADCVTCHGRHSVECGECGSHTKDCAGTCSTCAVCSGTHMLTRAAFEAWHRANEPLPASRPEPTP